MKEKIKKRINEHTAVIKILDLDQIMNISNLIIKAFKDEKRLFLFGNGGSAADAVHLSAEFAGRYLFDRPPLPAFALNANISTMTAVANDYSYETIFERQIQAYAKSGDIVIGISTSGNSGNVLKAIKKAKELNAITVGFSGTKGELKNLVDHSLTIDSMDTPRIQEAYMFAGHMICELVEEELYGKK